MDEIFYDERIENGVRIGDWIGKQQCYDDDTGEPYLGDERWVEFDPPTLEDGLNRRGVYECEIEKRGEGDNVRYVVVKIGDVIAEAEGGAA